MKRSTRLIAVCILLLVNMSSVSSLNVTNASEGKIPLYMEIRRIKVLDIIERAAEFVDWHWYITINDGGECYIQESSEKGCLSDKYIRRVHNFSVSSRYVRLYIDLVDDDELSYQDLADISSHAGGGIDNYREFTRGTRFSALYDVKNNQLLDADEFIKKTGCYITSGEFDGSDDVDENDAELWFNIWDEYEPPRAEAGPDMHCARGEEVILDASGSFVANGSYIAEYEWDLDDDGEFETKGATARHTFDVTGEYTVTLRVKDSLSELSVDTCVVRVGDSPPVASFTYNPKGPSILDSVQFNDTSSDPEGLIISWHWEFGDGDSSTVRDPVHGYADKGTYEVELTIEDNTGNTDTRGDNITVVNLRPVADFSFSPEEPERGQDIHFVDESRDPEGRALRCVWDFDDGHTSIERSPIHGYQVSGNYYVGLTVTDDEGGVDSITRIVSVIQRHDLTLIVRDPLGIAVSRAEVTLLSDDGYAASSTTNEYGMAVLPGLPEGLYEVRVRFFGLTTSMFCPLTASMTEMLRVTLSVYTMGIAGGMLTVLALVGVVVMRKNASPEKEQKDKPWKKKRKKAKR
jgi:PKD repeat protein